MTNFFAYLFAGTAVFVYVPIEIFKRLFKVQNKKLNTIQSISSVITIIAFISTMISSVIEGKVDTELGVACIVVLGGITLFIGGTGLYTIIMERIDKKKTTPANKLLAVYKQKEKADRNMKLQEICAQLADVEEMLDNGQIPYTYDKLMAAMKADHPVEVLDEILAIIYYDVMAGKTPTLAKVKKTLAGLKKFQQVYKVDIKAPIKELEKYISGTNLS